LVAAAPLRGAHVHLSASREIAMKRIVAAITVTLFVAASFVDIASAGWSW
jgi:hypothetical protein